ncbi:hypothetical protein [Lentibacter sp. XHP0401]|jgi:hypothetical protein|uniref:hypothetical protein n=1 Tax=Lentibacter sp. XHP0401 TaxID=2984334 RepID=UPI0021E90231|nr:hypothetical protein [Lentibacter sp. XHP0401]MCV2894390.1 hypothetical protein [Lentibacter sp. XHP0401]
MKHLLTTTVAFMLMTAATTATAETAKERKARCEEQGEIVTKAVELRLKRTKEAKANEEISATTAEALLGSVPLLVGYIYTLPRKDLKGIDVPAAFIEQCSAFEPE